MMSSCKWAFRKDYRKKKEQVASNKSNLLVKIQEQHKQALQLFTEIVKTKKYLQKLLNHPARRLGCRDIVVLLNIRGSTNAFMGEYLH